MPDIQREIIVSEFADTQYTSPISDLSFIDTNMLISERGMEDDTTPSAHKARALEYVNSSGSWGGSSSTFMISEIPNSSAGGGDYDYSAGGLVWNSADALDFGTPDFVYRFQGLPTAGSNVNSSVLLDAWEEAVKTEIGDIEVTCSAEELAVSINTMDTSTRT